VEIFHVEMGDPRAPVLLLVHGWPTSSIDWFEVAGQLSGRFRVCALDFPGYGFSDKPQGWGYSLARDEELIEFYLSEIIGAEAVVVVAHDRGDSVALLHAARCAEGRSATRLEHLALSNGNIFLPLSNLTQAQRQALDAQSWSQVVDAVTPSMLAEATGATTFTPPRTPGDPVIEALTATFALAGRALATPIPAMPHATPSGAPRRRSARSAARLVNATGRIAGAKRYRVPRERRAVTICNESPASAAGTSDVRRACQRPTGAVTVNVIASF
jgi:pimeloyl-ACP methyl ester carboxylesterase